MCRYCNPSRFPSFKKDYDEAVKIANEHLDSLDGTVSDIDRALVGVHIACNMNPFIRLAMSRCWVSSEALVN